MCDTANDVRRAAAETLINPEAMDDAVSQYVAGVYRVSGHDDPGACLDILRGFLSCEPWEAVHALHDRLLDAVSDTQIDVDANASVSSGETQVLHAIMVHKSLSVDSCARQAADNNVSMSSGSWMDKRTKKRILGRFDLVKRHPVHLKQNAGKCSKLDRK